MNIAENPKILNKTKDYIPPWTDQLQPPVDDHNHANAII